MAQRTFISLAALALIGSLTGMFLYLSPEDKPMPLPYETIVLDYEEDESKHLEKEKWIETMHRSAPDDNWRNMDQQHRLQAASQKKQSGDLPIYGKWRELGSNNQAGRTVYTYFDPETEDMYTASDGGQVWKGEIGADNWVPLNDHFKIPRIRFVTKIGTGNNTRLLVQSSAWNIAGIFFSDDDGLSWAMGEGLDNIIDWGFIKRTVVKNDPGKTVYCIAQEWDYSAWQALSAIYKTNDLGISFEKIQKFDYPVNNDHLCTSHGGESDVFVVPNRELYLLNE